MTTQHIILTIPTSDAINANQRLHHMAKARKTAAIRQRAFLAARAALGNGFEPMERAQVTVWLSFGDKRLRDPANFYPTIKAAIDGMVGDAGCLPGDDSRYLDGPDMRIGAVGVRGFMSMRFEFQEVEG